MSSLRNEIRVGAPVDAVWALVSDSRSIARWFPSIATCTVDGNVRVCTLKRGGEVREQIVNVDHAIRRFQYRILEGIPVDRHLGTVDVIEIGADDSLVVYSTEAEPDGVGDAIGAAVRTALADLKSVLEVNGAE